MKRIIIISLMILGIYGANKANKLVIEATKAQVKASDPYIRDRVVMLTNGESSCTGIQVKAPSQKVYILTARHCGALLDDQKSVKAIMEDGKSKRVYFVKISLRTDLMLLTSVDTRSIDIASVRYKYERIHTLTHGKGLPTHRSDGEIITTITIPISFQELVLDVSTAVIRPGSSGGPVLNEAGELLGIVSARDEDNFSYSVPLEHIQAFMADR